MIKRFDQNHRRSRAVVAGGFVFLAGQVADDKTQGVDVQTRQVFAKIDALLSEVGTDKSHLLTAQIWLADIRDIDAFNALWDEWVVDGHAPTRCCGQVLLTDPAMRVEIVVSAALA